MYKVYWTASDGEVLGQEMADMTVALNVSKRLRDAGHRFVTMVSENPDVVGKAGVDSVINGKLPDGSTYDWKKRRT